MNDLVLGTRNNGKIKSFKSFLSPYFNLQDLKEFSWENFIEAEESGKTFAENSIIKAQNYGDFLKLPILSEDAGIIIEAIPEMFGVRSKREIIAKNDQEWLKKFLEIVVPLKNRRATFYSCLTYYDVDRNICKNFTGKIAGEIVDFPRTPLESGIPVSSVFLPDGQDLVFSAMTQKNRNKFSHRGESLQKFLQWCNDEKIISYSE